MKSRNDQIMGEKIYYCVMNFHKHEFLICCILKSYSTTNGFVNMKCRWSTSSTKVIKNVLAITQYYREKCKANTACWLR